MVSLGFSFAAVCCFFSYDFVGLIVNHKTSGRDSHLGYLGMGCDFIKARLMYTHVIVACLYSEQLAQSKCTWAELILLESLEILKHSEITIVLHMLAAAAFYLIVATSCPTFYLVTMRLTGDPVLEQLWWRCWADMLEDLVSVEQFMRTFLQEVTKL